MPVHSSIHHKTHLRVKTITFTYSETMSENRGILTNMSKYGQSGEPEGVRLTTHPLPTQKSRPTSGYKESQMAEVITDFFAKQFNHLSHYHAYKTVLAQAFQIKEIKIKTWRFRDPKSKNFKNKAGFNENKEAQSRKGNIKI